jgi:tetratricopeptide (TPR) repeat protein
MQLSQESYRIRWLVLVSMWSLAGFVFFTQASAIRQYLDLIDAVGVRNPQIPTPLRESYPAFAADAQVWVRHALSLVEGNNLRLRHTTIDNAPLGREVHWNSAWAWAIAGAGWVHHLFTGLPYALAVERSTVWFPVLVLWLLTVIFSAWATRQGGLIAGLVVAAAMVCHDRIYEGFFPSYVDHHGLLTVAVFGTVLGAVFMGGGWWQDRGSGKVSLLPSSPALARQGALFSAVSGAFGLWVSAASVIPGIAITGISGLAATLLVGRAARSQGASFDAASWRIWGRVGAAGSLIFYLLEYFPSYMSFRLEPNHPFHAFAWLGGGELIALLGERWLATSDELKPTWRQYIWPIIAVSVTPITILIGGSSVLSFADTFMTRLHNDYIQEFLPIWMTMRSLNAKMVFQVIVVDSAPLLAAIATLTYCRRESPIVLWFATLIAFLLSTMAWAQSRWLLNASGAQIALIVVLIGCWTKPSQKHLRWAIAAVAIGGLFVPTGVLRLTGTAADIRARRIAPRDAFTALNRDIAAVLRSSQPEGDIILLASPNASTGIGYYGRFKTIGTLYWENHAGLKAAAAIFGAKTEDEAAKLIKERKITHIAIVAEENFIREYYMLLHPGAPLEELNKCFGVRLFFQRVVPQWLQMIPYPVPADLQVLNTRVMLFKVNFAQSLPDAIYNAAETQIAEGALEDADRTLDVLTQKTPQFPQPWLRKAEIQVTRRKWSDAAEYFFKGISLASAAERPRLYASAAHTFYNQGQHSIAIETYRRALNEQRTPELLSYLAWILATSVDDTLRDGKEALALAQESLRGDPNAPNALMALAAAYAELNRFAEARTAAEQAVANAQVRKEVGVIPVFLQRLEVVKSGKQLRN